MAMIKDKVADGDLKGSKLSNMFQRADLFFKSRKSMILLIVLSVLILIWRRPGQVFYPYIWCEDAHLILNDYIHNGFWSLFLTVQGYFITSSKLINFIAYHISFWYYPEIAAFLANIFIVGVILAIAYSPTHLKMPWFCALFALLVKTDPECFGVALYSFWWAGLLLVLVVLWKSEERPVLRNILLLLGGFSSPLVMVATPMLVFRALYERKRNELITASISFVPFVVQGWAMMKNHVTGAADVISFHTAYEILIKYFGFYVYNFDVNFSKTIAVLSLLLFLGIIFCGIKFKIKGFKNFLNNNIYYLLLLGWLAASIVSSVLRVDVSITHPYLAGPRYYFYPYIILSWLIIWVISENRSKVAKTLFSVVILTFLFDGSIQYMTRDQYKIDWRANLAECMRKIQRINYLLIPQDSAIDGK